MSRDEMLEELRALSEKVERPVQVYLDYRNERRAEALRWAVANLEAFGPWGRFPQHAESGRPLAVDLFCGLGGWTEGLLAEGYSVVGFDVERHVYGEHRYPAQLVLQDVRTIHGRQFKDAALVVASPPCQEFSYMAMPWSRAKQIARALRGEGEFPTGYKGSRTVQELTALFDACFRIQREACEAAGRHIPMVVENVKGAQPWVGKARWSYGSYYLWGDVPALMPLTFRGVKVAGMNWSGSDQPGYRAVAFNDPRHLDARKNDGGSWFAQSHSKEKNQNARDNLVREMRWNGASFDESDAVKNGGDWFSAGAGMSQQRRANSKSTARKAASARIAKIPEALARHIAHVYYPAGLFQDQACGSHQEGDGT